MYYLAPDGDPSREPYGVLLEALRRKGRYGIGQVVFSGKEQVVLVRPYEDSLQMALLNYEAEIKRPAEVVGEVPRIGSTNRNVRLAEQLIDSLSEEDFDFGRYQDAYLEKVRELIEAKVEGRDVVAPPEEEEEADIVNLMDALRKSIGAETKKKPAAPSARARTTAKKAAGR
jgi:DNA end-binding protein Ku